MQPFGYGTEQLRAGRECFSRPELLPSPVQVSCVFGYGPGTVRDRDVGRDCAFLSVTGVQTVLRFQWGIMRLFAVGTVVLTVRNTMVFAGRGPDAEHRGLTV